MGEGTLGGFFEAWGLFRDPALAGTAAGAVLGLLGVYVVLRHLVFLTAAVSQVAGLGVAVSFLSGAPPLAGATVLTAGAVALVARDRDAGASRRDALLGLLFLAGAAGTLAVGSRLVQDIHEIDEILLGTAVAVLPEDVTLVFAVSGLVLALHAWGWRGFSAVSFDRDGARVRGLPVPLLETVLFGSLAVAVAVTTWVLGALPTFAFSVLPGFAAVRVAPNVGTSLVLAALFGAAAGFGGYLGAYLTDLPVGASETLAALAVVVLAEVFRALRALLASSRAEA